jgi:type I restriction enzyme S subunit
VNFIPRNRTDPWFLAYLLCHHTVAISQLAGETTYKEVSRKKLKSFRVAVPSIEDQRRIVKWIWQCLERIDEIRALRSEVSKQAAAVFPSLLSARFSQLFRDHPTATIDECCIETRYGTSRRCDTNARGVPVLRIPNVADGAVNDENLKFCELPDAELPKLALQAGDLLCVRTNGSRGLVGRCAVFDGQDRQYAFASYLIRVRFDQEQVDPRYVGFFLESTAGRDAIAERIRTSAGQYNINSKSLRSIHFPTPPLKLQRAIANEMSHQRRMVHEIFSEHHEAHAQGNALSEAILSRAFAGKL